MMKRRCAGDLTALTRLHSPYHTCPLGSSCRTYRLAQRKRLSKPIHSCESDKGAISRAALVLKLLHGRSVRVIDFFWPRSA